LRELRAEGLLQAAPAGLSLEHDALGGVVGVGGGDAAAQRAVDRCCLCNVQPLFSNGDMRAAR
jgi:hypothetical protein